MSFDIKGQRAIVTGASSGIGKAVVLALLQAGAHVALVSRGAVEFLTEIAEFVKSTGSTAKAYPIDLADLTSVKQNLEAIATDFGGVDILINNAGTGYVGEVIDTPLSEWQRVMDLNVTSVFQCIQALLPTLRAQHSGTIINVASVAGKQAFPQWGAYCASKFAILGLTQALAAEERSHGIKVMAICPGSVDTPIWDKLDPAIVANFNRQLMLKPDSVAHAIMHLLSLPSEAVVTDYVLLPNVGTF